MIADHIHDQAPDISDEPLVIPIVEERAIVGRKTEDGRSISVTTRPITERVTVSEVVVQEDIVIDRVPVDRIVESLPPVRKEGDLTVIPVVEERLKVTVELVLREEIHIRRTKRNVTENQDIELTRTEVDITRS
jgi:stress response protein YsnF